MKVFLNSASVHPALPMLHRGAARPIWRSTGSGTDTAAVCSPARLNAFVGAMQVTLFSQQAAETEAKGMYPHSGAVRSQWISSEMTVTWCFWHSSPMWARVSRSQSFPTGLRGLQRIISEVWGSLSFRSRSLKSMA